MITPGTRHDKVYSLLCGKPRHTYVIDMWWIYLEKICNNTETSKLNSRSAYSPKCVFCTRDSV